MLINTKLTSWIEHNRIIYGVLGADIFPELDEDYPEIFSTYFILWELPTHITATPQIFNWGKHLC